jgi:hypothetical protein
MSFLNGHQSLQCLPYAMIIMTQICQKFQQIVTVIGAGYCRWVLPVSDAG